MEKKYQIFISSTYMDLKDARDKVRDAILSIYQFPVGMELFGAASAAQWEIIKDTIDCSDYYVLIIGHRYGTIIQEGTDGGISYTEKEFRYAKESGIPILVFLMDDSVPITPDKMEQNAESKKKLDAFIAEAKTGRTVVWWNSVDDLARKVTASLHNEFERTIRPGWIRADSDKDDITNIPQEIIDQIARRATPKWEVLGEQASASNVIIGEQRLNHDAMIMLAYASKDGKIMLLRDLSGTSIAVGKWDFVRSQNSREIARWKDAIKELERFGYIELVGQKDKIYNVTSDGYKIADVVISKNELDLDKPPDTYLAS